MKKISIFWETVWVPQAISLSPLSSQKEVTNMDTAAWGKVGGGGYRALPLRNFFCVFISNFYHSLSVFRMGQPPRKEEKPC